MSEFHSQDYQRIGDKAMDSWRTGAKIDRSFDHLYMQSWWFHNCKMSCKGKYMERGREKYRGNRMENRMESRKWGRMEGRMLVDASVRRVRLFAQQDEKGNSSAGHLKAESGCVSRVLSYPSQSLFAKLEVFDHQEQSRPSGS
jgi:hypothetical protein